MLVPRSPHAIGSSPVKAKLIKPPNAVLGQLALSALATLGTLGRYVPKGLWLTGTLQLPNSCILSGSSNRRRCATRATQIFPRFAPVEAKIIEFLNALLRQFLIRSCRALSVHPTTQRFVTPRDVAISMLGLISLYNSRHLAFHA